MVVRRTGGLGLGRFGIFVEIQLMRHLTILLLLTAVNLVVCAQDSIVVRQTALRDDYINKVKAAGFTPSLAAPPVVVNNPPSWGNYDDSANIIETCNWQD